MFRKPPLFYAFLFIVGFILGEIISSSLYILLPKSGALEFITQTANIGFESIKLDLYFFLVNLGLKLRVSVLGILMALVFIIIGRFL